MILAVDIGGTKTYAALFPVPPSGSSPSAPSSPAGSSTPSGSSFSTSDWHPTHLTRWPSRDFDFRLLREFIRTANLTQPIQAAGFSLAGPIVGDQCQLVNLDKTLEFSAVRQELPQIEHIVFANDLVATAHSLQVLPTSSFVSLTEHLPAENAFAPQDCYPIAVLSLGTGLGQSTLLSPNQALSSEGAHADFAPTTEQQVRLWRYLKQHYEHVSYERLLSGLGLQNIYAFLAQEKSAAADIGTTPTTPTTLTPKAPTTPAPPATQTAPSPTPPEITSRGLDGTCPLCQATLHLFTEILGAQAGNFALQTMSVGGIYLAGGIISHILPALCQAAFRQAFVNKGRFSGILQQIPITAVCDDRAALWGAGQLAKVT
ncbi:MAG: glucokinase [Peptococcaceae bacterium]|nr:glucokinase [Peptococcaceae bacterium]